MTSKNWFQKYNFNQIVFELPLKFMDLCSDSDNIEFFSKTDITFFHEALHIRSFSTGVVQRAHTNSGKHISHAPDS